MKLSQMRIVSALIFIFVLQVSTAFAADLSSMAKITGVRFSYGSGTVRVVIDLTKEVEFVENVAENPSRSIIDIKNAWIPTENLVDTPLESLAAKNLRVAQFDSQTVRVVIETMAAIKPFKLSGGPGGYRLVIDVGNAPFQENPELNNRQQQTTETPQTETQNPATEIPPQETEQQRREREKQERREQRERERLERERQKQERREQRERERLERQRQQQQQQNQNQSDNQQSDIDKQIDNLIGLKGKIIVIDPGHGGNDSGAIGPTGVMEKSVTLNVALELEKLLKSEGAIVIMTRSNDNTVSPLGADAGDIEELQARCDVANQSKADIFISIHADSFTKPDARGTTAYYYSQAEDERGKKLAESIRGNLCERLGTPSRGTKACNFYVVRHSDMPATLIELAFISNAEEEQLLNSEDGVLKAAQGIFDGIADYFE